MLKNKENCICKCKKKIPKKKQPKKRNKKRNIIKVNVNTSTSGGSGGSTIPYPIYPISQQMFPANTPPNIYNVFTKDPVKTAYTEPETENVKETEMRKFTPKQIPRKNIFIDDGITFSEKDESRNIDFDAEAPPNLTSQLVVSKSPFKLREAVRTALSDNLLDKELQEYSDSLDRQGLTKRQIGQRIRRFKDNRKRIQEKYNI